MSFGLGTGMIGLCVLGLGLIGHLTPVPVFTLLVLGTLITLQSTRELFGRVKIVFRSATSNQESRLLILLGLGVLSVFILRAQPLP